MLYAALAFAVSLTATVLHGHEFSGYQESREPIVVVLIDPWCIPCAKPFLDDGMCNGLSAIGRGADVGRKVLRGIIRIEPRARYPPRLSGTGMLV